MFRLKPVAIGPLARWPVLRLRKRIIGASTVMQPGDRIKMSRLWLRSSCQHHQSTVVGRSAHDILYFRDQFYEQAGLRGVVTGVVVDERRFPDGDPRIEIRWDNGQTGMFWFRYLSLA